MTQIRRFGHKRTALCVALFGFALCPQPASSQSSGSAATRSGEYHHQPQPAADSTLDARIRAVSAALRRALPRPVWCADGTLSYRRRVHGRMQRRLFDPRSGSDTGGACPDSAGEAEPATAEPRVVQPGRTALTPPVMEVPSPDGKWLAGTREGNIWLRSADSTRYSVQLTDDGTVKNGYTVLEARWSPDGRYLATRRWDAREVPTIPIVDWSQPGEPVHRPAFPRAGDPITRQTLVIIDRRSGGVRTVALPEEHIAYLHPVGWSADGRFLYVLGGKRLLKHVALYRVDVTMGRSRILMSETGRTNVAGWRFRRGHGAQFEAEHRLTMLRDGRFIWASQRDGWRRLYLHAASGKLIRPLTPAGVPVLHVLTYDAARGRMYYVAQAKRGVPYRDALFSVGLDGRPPLRVADGPAVLADGPGGLGVMLSPDGRYLSLSRGGRDFGPTLDVYSARGRHVRRLWSADSVLRALPHRPPELFEANAADGKTTIYGVLVKPPDFDPSKKYPVLENVYPAPFEAGGPPVPGVLPWFDWVTAIHGFVCVEIYGRGTPGRGKRFVDAFYGRIGQGFVADHVAALRQAAATRPWMDLKRVGVFGHSFGGWAALDAVLEAPDVYHAAVASALQLDLGASDYIEPYMGCLPATCPDAYGEGSNGPLIGRLRGKLLILHGTADRDVPFGETMRLVAALEKAGKPYQLAVFPGGNHTIVGGPYWEQRVWRFLKQALGGPEPRAP